MKRKKCRVCGVLTSPKNYFKGHATCKKCVSLSCKKRCATYRKNNLLNPPTLIRKKCVRCGKIRHTKNFPRANSQKDGYSSWCKSCTRSYNGESYIRNSYGMDKGQYNDFINSRHSRCDACGDKVAGTNRHVDHDHKTGRVRGLLCRRCNWMVGASEDGLEILTRVGDYIRNHCL